MLFRRSGRGKRSGMEIGQLAGSRGADVLDIREGKVVKLVTYWTATGRSPTSA